MDHSMTHVEVPAKRMGQGMFSTKTGIAEGHGGGNRGDAQLFQAVKRSCLDGLGQVSDDQIDGL